MSQAEAERQLRVGTRKTIRVVIAEDQAMVLGALAALLEMEGDIRVVAQVRNGRQAYEAVRANCPDVLITDIEMPEMTGLERVACAEGPFRRPRVCRRGRRFRAALSAACNRRGRVGLSAEGQSGA